MKIRKFHENIQKEKEYTPSNNKANYILPNSKEEIKKIKKEYKAFEKCPYNEIENIVNDIKNFILNNLNFKNIYILYTNILNEDVLGFYVIGSSLNLIPVIILDYINIIDMQEKKYELEDVIEFTIYNEIVHSIIDIDNAYIFKKGKKLLNYNNPDEYSEKMALKVYKKNFFPNKWKYMIKCVKDNKYLKPNENYKINNNNNNNNIIM